MPVNQNKQRKNILFSGTASVKGYREWMDSMDNTVKKISPKFKLSNILLTLLLIHAGIFTHTFGKILIMFKNVTYFFQFFTEAFFEYPILKEMMRHNGPKYFYRFQYTGGPSLWEQMSNRSLQVDGKKIII